jgi:hypothetical protein
MPNDHPTRRAGPNRWAVAAWVLVLACLVATLWWPVRSSAIRTAIVTEVLLLWAGAVWLTDNVKPARVVLLGLVVPAILVLAWPGRS